MKVKKLISTLLAFIMIVSLTPVIAFAQEPASPSEEAIDAALVDRGYPQIVLNEMSITAKRSIYEDTSLYFKGATITTYDEETGTFEDFEIPENGIIPYGQISTSDLSLVWSVNADEDNPDLIIVQYSYKWNKLPFFRWQDPIAVSWDSDLFEMQDDSFYKVDNYDGYVVDPSSGLILSTITGGIHSQENGYAKGFSSGVTWYADLKGYLGITVTKLYGYGEFVLEKKTSKSGTSKIYGHYVHPTASISLSVNISDYGSFSVSGGSNYDERGNQTTFEY